MRDFLLQTLGIADSDNQEIFFLVEAKEQHSTAGAISERRQCLIQSLWRATAISFNFNVV
jgi:hypothetical protein